MSNKIIIKKAIILLSGGMDSTTCLSIAIKQGCLPYALHLNYGQHTEKRELKSYTDICDFYKIDAVRRLVVDISYLKKIGGSALIANRDKIKMDGVLSGADEIPATYVPFRNAHILSIAVSWAEVVGATSLFFGALEEDSSGYPDCRKEFIRAFETAANLGTKTETAISIETPLLHLTKAQIIQIALKNKTPLELTWSCYSREDIPCQLCDSCLLRARGFNTNRSPDPLPKGVAQRD